MIVVYDNNHCRLDLSYVSYFSNDISLD